MNNTRWLLLVPLLISSICLAGAIFLTIKANSSQPDSMTQETYVKWHTENIKSEDPDILRQHSQKLWKLLLITDNFALGNYERIFSLISSLIVIFAGNLLFCLAAFFFSKNKKIEQGAWANGTIGSLSDVPNFPPLFDLTLEVGARFAITQLGR